MIELWEKSDVLDSIKDFLWDKEYTPVESRHRKQTKSTFLYRGIATSDEAIVLIENISCFYAWWNDTEISHANGIGPTSITKGPTNVLAGKIEENSEQGEFQLFVLYWQKKGQDMKLYEKWLAKMENGKPLSKPVYGKLIGEYGNEYTLEKTAEVLSIFKNIVNQSRIKNFD